MVENPQVGITAKQEKEIETLIAKKEGKVLHKRTQKPLAFSDKDKETLEALVAKRDAEPELSVGVKSYLSTVLYDILFNRKIEFTSPQTKKGNEVEEESITLYTEVSGDLKIKNKDQLSNDYIQGTPDLKIGIIEDMKNAFHLGTFPMFKDTYVSKSDHVWQTNGYKWLTNQTQSRVVYTLMDTPIDIIKYKLEGLKRKLNKIDFTIDEKEHVVKLVTKHIFTHEGLKKFCDDPWTPGDISWFDDFVEIPAELRVKRFPIESTEESFERDIERIKARVVECRAEMIKMTRELYKKLEKRQAA